MKMIDHNHFICHLILGTFTEYPTLGDIFNATVLQAMSQPLFPYTSV